MAQIKIFIREVGLKKTPWRVDFAARVGRSP
jgi:hypothetical protein